MTRFTHFLLAIGVAVSLAACTSNKPSDSQALADALKLATTTYFPSKGFDVGQLTRENGWVEGTDYKIKFTYDLVTNADYEHVIAMTLKEVIVEAKDASSWKRDYIQSLYLEFIMSESSSALSKWYDLPAVAAMPAVASVLDTDPYVVSHPEVREPLLGQTVLFLNSYKVPRGAPKGTKVPRYVEVTYYKTEKGWVLR